MEQSLKGVWTSFCVSRHLYSRLLVLSGHVESIALLERVSNRKADAKVHIDVDLEDYYRIKDAQGKDGK